MKDKEQLISIRRLSHDLVHAASDISYQVNCTRTAIQVRQLMDLVEQCETALTQLKGALFTPAAEESCSTDAPAQALHHLRASSAPCSSDELP